jgi:hypothetical protein
VIEYNLRFAVEPREAEDAHRSIQPTENLDRILRLSEQRVLSKNLTLSYNSVLYQSSRRRAAYTMRGAKVEVRATSRGGVSIEYKGHQLDHSVYREQEQQQSRVPPSKMLDAALSQPTAKPKRKVWTRPDVALMETFRLLGKVHAGNGAPW